MTDYRHLRRHFRTVATSFALAAMTTFTFAQTPPAGAGTNAPPAAPPVAGPAGQTSVGIAGPAGQTSVGIARPGQGIGIAGPGQGPGIAGPGAASLLPANVTIATTPVNGIDASEIGVATDGNFELGVATDVADERTTPASPPVATTPADALIDPVDIGILGQLDATDARLSRPLSETALGSFGLADAAPIQRFRSRVLIRGSEDQIELVMQD